MLDETRKGLALLGKLEQYDFDFKTLCMVKNLYILSRLSYGLESFGPFLSEGQIDLVDLNLKKIARRITGCSIYTRSLPLLLEANMLPMKLIIEKQARTALFRYRSLKWVRSTNRIANFDKVGSNGLGAFGSCPIPDVNFLFIFIFFNRPKGRQ